MPSCRSALLPSSIPQPGSMYFLRPFFVSMNQHHQTNCGREHVRLTNPKGKVD
jgi:hypothetical protein